MIRQIVRIDEEKCDGCGLCIPSCHEGAIRLVNGKARLVSDVLCDGLGACLGHCPQGAISVEQREAAAFDEAAVAQAAQSKPAEAAPFAAAALPQLDENRAPLPGGCPGSRMMRFDRKPSTAPRAAANDDEPASELAQWPVQFNLLPANAPVLHQASLLISADCVPVAYAGFHSRLLRGRAVLIGCPKFDDLDGYVTKLAAIIRQSNLLEIEVARMQVPCCMGILSAVLAARAAAGIEVPVTEVVISTDGRLLARYDHGTSGERRFPPAAVSA